MTSNIEKIITNPFRTGAEDENGYDQVIFVFQLFSVFAVVHSKIIRNHNLRETNMATALKTPRIGVTVLLSLLIEISTTSSKC